MGSASPRLIIYCLAILSPLVGVAVFHLPTQNKFIYDVGRSFALLGFAMLTMQILLAARLKWAERPFGLNMMFPFHKAIGVYVTVLLFMHPMLLAAGGPGWRLLIGGDVHWYIWVGRGVLLLLLVNTVSSVFRTTLGVSFERWRLGHGLFGPAILALAFSHSWVAGGDLKVFPMQFLWVGLLSLGMLFYSYHRFWNPRRFRCRPYRVREVRQEAHNVWTLEFDPPPGIRRFDFSPGQFQFVTLLRGRGLPVEEHHFTISSSPTEAAFHSSTIKESGDFTASIGQTKKGDFAAIQGPFGRFSYLLHPEERNLCFVAGGIGITPLMSNLRHMRDTGADRNVLLLYSNRTEEDILFREELSRIEKEEKPALKVIHLLSRPGEAWKGVSGRVDRQTLERFGGGYLAKGHFYVCGPPPLTRSVITILASLGVKDARIFFETFSL
jgi:predicted ferric reductase